MRLREIGKYAAYRTPFVRKLMAPAYGYKVDPGELCAMVNFIDSTRSLGGAIAEVGVAKGETSAFLLEHLVTTGDDRTLYLLDTFSGFTDRSVEHEISTRRKAKRDYDAFRYGDEARFRANLRGAGYSRFRTIKGDAASFDWSSIAPIGALLLDIDLYQPTIAVLEAAYPHIAVGGGIVVDDCLPDTPWDGSLQAYKEFISQRGLPFERVGHKGAVIRGPLSD